MKFIEAGSGSLVVVIETKEVVLVALWAIAVRTYKAIIIYNSYFWRVKTNGRSWQCAEGFQSDTDHHFVSQSDIQTDDLLIRI